MKYGICAIWIFVMSWSCVAAAADTPRIEFSPENPESNAVILYSVKLGSGCGDKGVVHLIDYDRRIIKISVEGIIAGVCPGGQPTGNLGYLPAGTYQVEVYRNEWEGEPFAPENLRLVTELVVEESPRRQLGPAHHEWPEDGSTQSGIGVVRGWACNASNILITIDGKPYIAGYGVSRGDTLEKCGDIDNGYSMLVNWSLFGEGWHTMSVYYADVWGNPYDALVKNIEFQVVTLDKPYYKDLQRNVRVPDFPHEGEYVILKWSTPDQNFKITRHRHR